MRQTDSMREELATTRFKKKIERQMEAYLEGKGFELVEPRALQRYDDYLFSNTGQDMSKTVKVLGGDSTIFILRPDLTTNILGEILPRWNGKGPLKIYYNSYVYQNGPGGSIEQRCQIGAESLGGTSSTADGEIVGMAEEIMDMLGERYVLEVGSSTFLESCLERLKLGCDDANQLKDLIRKKNRHGLREKLKSLSVQEPVLESILDLEGEPQAVFRRAHAQKFNTKAASALQDLERLIKFLRREGLAKKIKVDLSLVLDLDYYDGIVFRAISPSAPTKIISGGRYDRLTEKYGRKIPAVGFMIDVDLATRLKLEGKING